MDAARKRLLLYLLLNVVVSACTTTLVLFVYYYSSRPSIPAAATAIPASVQMEQGTANPEIVTVIGAGLPSSEMLVIRNTGQSEANSTGWTLQDQQSNVYTFKEVTILPGGAIQLHTAPGTDSLIDLYWGLSASVGPPTKPPRCLMRRERSSRCIKYHKFGIDIRELVCVIRTSKIAKAQSPNT